MPLQSETNDRFTLAIASVKKYLLAFTRGRQVMISRFHGLYRLVAEKILNVMLLINCLILGEGNSTAKFFNFSFFQVPILEASLLMMWSYSIRFLGLFLEEISSDARG